MNKVLCFVIALFLVAGVLCGCSTDSSTKSDSKDPSHEVDISSFSEHNYQTISFKAPSNWREKENEYGYYLYLDEDFFYVTVEDVSKTGVEPIYKNGIFVLPEEAYNGYLHGVLSGFDPDYAINKYQETTINDHLFKHLIINGTISDNQTYVSMYATYHEGDIYMIMFVSNGSISNAEFTATEDDIIQSIDFKDFKKSAEVSSEVPTAAPTKVQTETPTNPPRLGKADNPAPLGETVEIYESDMTILNISIANVIAGEEANRLVKEYNQFNDDPPEGYHYVLFDVNVECSSTNKSGGFRVRYSNFCAANSTKAILKTTSVAIVLDNYLDATLLPGSMVTGKSAVLMPNDGDGYIVYDDRYFFALS